MDIWNYHDKKIKELKEIYNKQSRQTQLRLQELFDTFDFNYENIYNIADIKTKKRIDLYIEKWREQGLLKDYFGMLANSIYKRTRVKNSEILELLIYSAYIEEQSKIEQQELKVFKDVASYYYNAGINEVKEANGKEEEYSIIPDAIFLALLEKTNQNGLTWKQYIAMAIQCNVSQIYKQAIISIQQQKELKIDSSEFQKIIKQQNNQKININDNKISGAVDIQMIGLNNQAKVDGIKKADNNARVKFIAVEDDATTKMCNSLNNQIFYVNKINEFERYYGSSAKELSLKKFRVFGLVQGINIPPIIGHFHYCRSTITYNIDKPREEINKMLNMEYQDITNRVFNNKKEYTVKEQQYFVDKDGEKYFVDGKYVVISPTPKEKEVAKLLGETYGGRIRIVPRINKPKGIKTPDYVIRGNRYDLKEIYGNSDNTLYNAITKKKEQSDNFIFDISHTKMKEIDAIEQIQNIYKSKHKGWINEIILIKNNEVLKMYKRK